MHDIHISLTSNLMEDTYLSYGRLFQISSIYRHYSLSLPQRENNVRKSNKLFKQFMVMTVLHQCVLFLSIVTLVFSIVTLVCPRRRQATITEHKPQASDRMARHDTPIETERTKRRALQKKNYLVTRGYSETIITENSPLKAPNVRMIKNDITELHTDENRTDETKRNCNRNTLLTFLGNFIYIVLKNTNVFFHTNVFFVLFFFLGGGGVWGMRYGITR